MNVIELTNKYNDNKPVYINAAHIISVEQIGDDTWVYVSATREGGKTVHYCVNEQVASVVSQMLNPTH